MKIFYPGHEESTYDLEDGTVLFGHRGSAAHNLFVPKNDPNHIDDIDYLGFVIAPKNFYLGLTDWGSRGTKEVKKGCLDIVLYEIKKAFSLLSQGNPNILSILWTLPGDFQVKDSIGSQIIENRNLFVGKHVYFPFAGYAQAQLEKMTSQDPNELRDYLEVTYEMKYRGIHPNEKGNIHEPSITDPYDGRYKNADDKFLLSQYKTYIGKNNNIGYMGDKRKQLVLKYGYDCKNASHLIRLLKMCIEFLTEGEMHVYRTYDREELLDIKSGKWSLEEVKKYATDLKTRAKEAYLQTNIPAEPNKQEIEKLLISLIEQKLFTN